MSVNFTASFAATRFGPTDLLQGSPLRFSSDELAHALFTTGRAPGDTATHGSSSYWELVHRVALIPAYLRRTPHGRLARSGLALELDRSEKIGLSYALGQAMTSIFCRHVIGVRHLMHVDRYRRHYNLAFAPGQSRPDLFGWSPNGWVVAEAKGRSNAMESALRAKMRDQKRTLVGVGSDPVNLALGCCASFPSQAGTMRVDAVDPKESTAEPVILNGADLDRFLLAYYAPFLVVLDQFPEPQRTDDVTFVDIPAARLRIGLLTAIEQRVRAAAANEIRGLADEVQDLVRSRQLAEQFGDGSVFQADWDDELATRDWG